MSASEFEAHRRCLEGVAYRMLGTLADAQDVVQETYLRWMTAERHEIRDARAWLMTVCTRLATNALRSARVRRETYVGAWLPEPLLTVDPTRALELDESVSVALMVALETLSPLERAAFVLHDVFDYDFKAIADMLDRSPAACRKLASRARGFVREGRPRFDKDPDTQQSVVAAFVRAFRGGDVDGLARLLAEEASLVADGGGKASAIRPQQGPAAIARAFAAIFEWFARRGTEVVVEQRWFSGAPGVWVFEDEVLATAMSFEIVENRIVSIHAQRNPDKLDRLRERPTPGH